MLSPQREMSEGSLEEDNLRDPSFELNPQESNWLLSYEKPSPLGSWPRGL